jgi:ubiquinone/menaquinone biosynthesis C-methylase UbiE
MDKISIEPMNYFESQSTAARYAKGRPYFHNNTMEYVKVFLQLNKKLEQALDIACGTGLSTQALLDIAERVYGTDASEEMLRFARNPEKINYSLASAEQQPFPDQVFDLITVCSGVHWFNIDAFLAEAYRILKSDGWLILYDNFFLSEMKDVVEFQSWFPEIYLAKFPSPARNNDYNWSPEHLKLKNFILQKEEVFKNEISFIKEELILYFTTQSNISSAVESQVYSYAEIESWLNIELNRFFTEPGEKKTLYYGNKIQYLQKTA